MSIIDQLITDRTQPGPYDWNDFNRVGEAVEYVANQLAGAGYRADVIAQTSWTRQSIQSRQQMEQYIKNIKELRAVLHLPSGVPAAPDSIRFLTFEGANNIEKILADVEEHLQRLMRVYLHSDQILFFSGFAIYPAQQKFTYEGLYTNDNKEFIDSNSAKVYVRGEEEE